jgi:hypothetical protein
MHGGNETCIQDFDKETSKRRDHFRYLSIDVRTVLNWILEKCGVKV